MSVAFHEAGHAVVARWAGLRPGVVRIHPNGAGECFVDEPRRGADTIEYLRTYLAFAIAGKAAECLAEGVDPLHAAIPPAEFARRILWLERATVAEKRPEGGEMKHPDVRRWAVDQVAELIKDETLAFEIVDEILGPDALLRAVRVLRDRWLEVEGIAAELESERELVIN